MLKKIEKIYTENPFVDELVYFTKLIAVNAVIKDSDLADKYETVESMKESDLYIKCREGKAVFESFTYDRKFLSNIYAIPKEDLDIYVLNNQKIPLKYRDMLLELKVKDYIDNYNEKNLYYRMLHGLPPIDENPKNFVYVPEDYVAGIPGITNIDIPVHLMPDTELTLLYSHGIIAQLVEDNPDKKYLEFMGDNALDIYKARKALNFQLLYIPVIGNPEIMDKWYTKYEQNRMFTLKTYYSDAYKLNSDYYNNFIMVFIVLQTMIDIISEVQEFITRREIFDDRSIRYLFESYGIPYYPEIPRVYQLAMLKNLNTLIKWKASTKNMIDICSLFGFKEVKIFRYYLLRDRKIDIKGTEDKKDDEYIFEYKDGLDSEGNTIKVPDNDKNYELKFVKVPIEDTVDNYLKDRSNYEDYDDITKQDEFWDGKLDHELVKSAILDKEFSWVRTKYISIDTVYDLSELCFDLPYFINMLVDDWIKEEYLYINIPVIKNNHKFRVNDIFVYLMALTFVYNGFEDKIMDTNGKILSILGFNFHVDMHELAQDILWNNNFIDIHEMGADYFYIPEKEVDNFPYLLKIFTKNKQIWKTICRGMISADNKRIYDAYKKVYESLFIEDLTFTFFKLQDGTQAKTYTEFLKERDYVLYENMIDIKSFSDPTSMRKYISDQIIEIVYALDQYMDSENFKYIFARFPAASGDYIRYYMLKVIDFFKSYKVHMLGISTIYKAFDKRENTIRMYEDWFTTGKIDHSTILALIEEITLDNKLSKSTKIDILEKIKFDIERWEYLHYKDKYTMAIKQEIAEIISRLTCSTTVTLVDHEKDSIFHEIVYGYDRDESGLSAIDSVEPNISKITNDSYKLLDKIQFKYISE